MYESPIFNGTAVKVDSILDCAFHIVKKVVGSTSQNNRGKLALVGISFEDDDFLASDFLHESSVAGTDFFCDR